jgi:methyl-accepting chemotaxis protein
VSEASSLWDGIKSKVSDVISSATETLKAKAQEVKDKIQELVSGAQQIGKNIGPCISGQSEAADSVLKLAGTASRRFYQPFTERSHFMSEIHF